MATFAQMQTWVSKRLQDPNNTAVSAADVGELINSAKSFWKDTRFWFNERTVVDVLTESNSSIPLPADWLCPSVDNCFVIEYSGIRYPLQKLEEINYNAVYLSNGIGQPWWFSRQADTEYKTYPIPDRDYDIRMFYLKNYDDYSDTVTTDDFSEKASGLIQYTAAAWGSRDFRQDIEMHDNFWAQAQRELKNLLSMTRKDNATGSLTVYSTLMG